MHLASYGFPRALATASLTAYSIIMSMPCDMNDRTDYRGNAYSDLMLKITRARTLIHPRARRGSTRVCSQRGKKKDRYELQHGRFFLSDVGSSESREQILSRSISRDFKTKVVKTDNRAIKLNIPSKVLHGESQRNKKSGQLTSFRFFMSILRRKRDLLAGVVAGNGREFVRALTRAIRKQLSSECHSHGGSPRSSSISRVSMVTLNAKRSH